MSSRFDDLFASAEGRFLDLFGDGAVWNGQPVTVIPRQMRGDDYHSENAPETGVLRRWQTLDIPANSIQKPYPWEEIDLDGESWIVFEAYKIGGFYTVTLFQDYA